MNRPALITMQGPKKNKILNMSNFEVGAGILAALANGNPGIKWSQLVHLEKLKGSDCAGCMGRRCRGWGCVGSFFEDAGSAAADVIKDIGTYIPNKGGDLLRLATDEKVMDGLSRAGTAYATGGASEGVKSVGDIIMDFISGLGQSAKTALGSAPSSGASETTKNILPWAIAGGAVLLVVALKK